MIKLIAIALITMAILAPIFANGAKEETSGETVFTVASSCDYPPLEYIDDNGNMVGYEIALWNEIAKVTGVKLEFYNVAFDGVERRSLYRSEQHASWLVKKQASQYLLTTKLHLQSLTLQTAISMLS